MVVPFEKIFGDTSELRVVQFLLPIRGYEFNIKELAEGAGVSRQALNSVVKKLLKWNVLEIKSKHSNSNYYALNENSGFIEAFESLNNRIIEQMLGEKKLAEIANYSLEQFIQTKPIEICVKDQKEGWINASGLQDEWPRVKVDEHGIQAAA